MRFQTSLIGLALMGAAFAFAACAADLDEGPEDGRDDVFAGGKADGTAIVEGSAEAVAVLLVANQSDQATLDDDVALSASAALNMTAHRRGADGRLGTADDDIFDTLAELDAVSYVGPVALQKLYLYAEAHGLVGGATIRVTRAARVADVPAGRPLRGEYRIHMIDVGSGLAILLQGYDFTVLFDGGSTDDKAGISLTGNKSRLLAYLFAALGPSGPPECAPLGDTWASSAGREVVIDHVFLSHPHGDHSSMLDEVLRCYRVRNVWDAGTVNDTATHADYLAAVAAEPDVRYHTEAAIPASRAVSVFGRTVRFSTTMPWTRFGDGDRVTLGDGATFKVLHVDGGFYANQFNRNSIVLRVDLGSTSLLLAADAESGLRADPSAPLGDVEQFLVEHYAADLDVDILQVGHHGSTTSSRTAFLDLVSPRYALISSGTTINNNGIRLPEAATMSSLADIGAESFRTDLHDSGCPEANRIGADDTRPGGCDSYVFEVR